VALGFHLAGARRRVGDDQEQRAEEQGMEDGAAQGRGQESQELAGAVIIVPDNYRGRSRLRVRWRRHGRIVLRRDRASLKYIIHPRLGRTQTKKTAKSLRTRITRINTDKFDWVSSVFIRVIRGSL